MGVVLRSKLVWSVMGVLLVISLHRMAMRQLARDPRFLALPHEVTIAAPRWGGEDVVLPVRQRLKDLGPINLFAAGFVRRVRDAVQSLPGVKSVDDVRRHWPDRYSVTFTLYRPAAVASDTPVTWDRVVLERQPYARAARGLLRIVGVDGDPPDPGTVWNNPRLENGLAALAQIAPHLAELNRLGIGTIDVSGADEPLKGVLLRGREGILVRWGRPLARVGENPVEQKIGYLREAARYVEQVRGMEIDVRFDTIYVRKPTSQ